MEIKLPTQPTEKKFKLISEFSRTLKSSNNAKKTQFTNQFPGQKFQISNNKKLVQIFFFC